MNDSQSGDYVFRATGINTSPEDQPTAPPTPQRGIPNERLEEIIVEHFDHDIAALLNDAGADEGLTPTAMERILCEPERVFPEHRRYMRIDRHLAGVIKKALMLGYAEAETQKIEDQAASETRS